MKRFLVCTALLAIACIGFAGTAKADSFTSGGVVWSFTGGGSDGSGGFFVTLTVDASNPTAGLGTSTLDTMAVQFFNAGSSATSASVTTSSNTSGWSFIGVGNVNQCGSGKLPFLCFQTGTGITITGGTDSGIYTFTFDVTGITGAPTTGDVQALQGSLPGSNGNFNISQDIPIGPPTTTPEPASMLLLGLGLVGVPFLRRKRS
jgi:PEP-CTERM motif